MKRYTLYAFGEILLVVVGILIALQINNHNEARKQNEAFKAILEIIKNDINADLEEIKIIKESYKTRSGKMDTILAGLDSEAFRKNCTTCFSLTTNMTAVFFNKRGYQLLKNHQLKKEMITDSLLVQIDDLYLIPEVSDLVTDNLQRLVFESLDDIRNNHDWLQDLLTGKRNEEIEEYMYENKNHLGRMTLFNLLVSKNYIPLLEQFEELAGDILIRIDEYLLAN